MSELTTPAPANNDKNWSAKEKATLRKIVAESGMEVGLPQAAAAIGRTVTAVSNMYYRLKRRKPRTPKSQPGLMSQAVMGGSLVEYLESRLTDDSVISFTQKGREVTIKF